MYFPYLTPEEYRYIFQEDDGLNNLRVYDNCFYCPDSDHVRLCTGTVVGNQRTLKLIKLSHVVRFYSHDVDELFEGVNEQMREDAFYLGGNAVVGWTREMHLWDDEPYAEGCGQVIIAGPYRV